MFSRLKKLLAECHIPAKDPAFKAAIAADENYLVTRAKEALNEITKGSLARDDDKNAILIIRLMALLRYKINPKEQTYTAHGADLGHTKD